MRGDLAVSTTHAPSRFATVRSPRWLPEALCWGALAGLAGWALLPIVYLLLRATTQDETLSGGEGLFGADQLQYLAWIRSSGEHVAAGNGFDLTTGASVYVQPMFVISGLLWRAGSNIALSYLIWAPVAVAALYFGFRSFCVRMLATPMARAAALILALFFVTPADPLAGWTVGSNGLGTFAGELSASGALYGYFPAAIAAGLSPLFMLGIDGILHTGPSHGRARSWYIAWTGVAGLIVSWLHPWQGVTLLIVTMAVLVLRRVRSRGLALVGPALATALPLGYYAVLSRADQAWRLAQTQSTAPRPNALLLLVALAPLLAFAAIGLGSGRRRDVRELILWLWPSAGVFVYFVAPGYSPHALEGIALPLVVLAVRGWQRLRWPAWLGAVAIVVCTLPGLAFNLHLFHYAVRHDTQALMLRQDETQALAYLDHAPGHGGVLPSLRISAAVPAYTGRRTWIGHASWTPDYGTRAATLTELFTGQLSGSSGRAFLREVGARYLLADCEPGFDPVWLGSLLVSRHQFGCVSVYELAVPNKASAL